MRTVFFTVLSCFLLLFFALPKNDSFAACTPPAKIAGQTYTYAPTSVQDAYDYASSPSGLGLSDFTLLLPAEIIYESLTLDGGSVVLDGGYECDYVTRTSNPTGIFGTFTVTSGTANFAGNIAVVSTDQCSFDNDIDGFFAGSCAPQPVDCNDNDNTVYPGAIEICDGIDNNCDGQIDEGTLPIDVDGDGYYGSDSCGNVSDDCDDLDPLIYPGASEIPYDGIDQDCNGADLTFPDGTVCTQCHGPANEFTFLHFRTIVPDGTCVSCHAALVNNILSGHYGRTVQTPDNNMSAGETILCASCHDQNTSEHPGGAHVVWGKVEADWPNLTCYTCHTAHDHSGITGTADCTICHNTGDPQVLEIVPLHANSCALCHDSTRQQVIAAINSGQAECLDCHTAHDHSGITGTADCTICHNTGDPQVLEIVPLHAGSCALCHNSTRQQVIDAIGSGAAECIDCHAPHDHSGITATPGCVNCHNTGDPQVLEIVPLHVDSCTLCHDSTRQQVIDAISSGQAECIDCHNMAVNHHGSSSGIGCVECHGHDAGTLIDADMQAPYTAGVIASQGKGSFKSHSTHTELTGADVRGPGIYCDTCHEINNFPTLKDGQNLANTTVCDACHSPDGMIDGVNHNTLGAKVNWASGVYSGEVLPAAKQLWCITCHDDGTANSMADGSGVNARNVAGDGTTYGFYANGHGRNNQVACSNCHDMTSRHIDHQYAPLTTVIESAPNPTNYRLYDGRGMTLPYNDEATTASFALCYTCHEESWITDGTTPGPDLDTNFRLDNYASMPTNRGRGNLHYLHIKTINFKTTCIKCHNPHGPPAGNPVMTDPNESGNFRLLTENGGLLYELTDPNDWHDPASNVGGAITAIPECGGCHTSYTDLSGGIPATDFYGNSHYLRTYKPPTFNIMDDQDNDTILDTEDNCIDTANSDQADTDGDGIGNACDNCVLTPNDDQTDADNDGIGDLCDDCVDLDADSLCSDEDNCDLNANPDQSDSDSDLVGDACDNCPTLSNPGQADLDNDGLGSLCDICPNDADNDIDADGICGDIDNCPFVANEDQLDTDGDSIGDACDLLIDSDGDGVADADDNCPSTPNSSQTNTDGLADGGDACDSDDDEDGIADALDNCPLVTNIDQLDNDDDQVGDACDNCPETVNPDQTDLDGDGIGEECEITCPTPGDPDWIIQTGTSSVDKYVAIDSDAAGNIYLAGYSSGDFAAPRMGYGDIVISKYTPSGTHLWSRQLGTDHSDEVRDIAVDAAGNSYTIGYTFGQLGDQSFGNTDMFVVKYDSNGNQQWIKQIGTHYYEYGQAVSIAEDGNILITGQTGGALASTNPVHPDSDTYVAKYDIDANLIWHVQLPGANERSPSALAQVSSGAIFLASGNILYRLDAAGSVVWQQTVGTFGAHPLAIDTDGNLLVTGKTFGNLFGESIGGFDIFLAKYDVDGNLIWGKQFGTSTSESANAVATDSDANIYLTGFTYGDIGGQIGANDIFVQKYTSDGNLLWTKQLGTTHNDFAYDLMIDATSNAFVIGSTANLFGTEAFGGEDMFLFKMAVGGCP